MEEPDDPAAWKDWFHRHGPRLLACARQWTRSLADAEDVVQDAFIRFWRNQRRLPGEPVAMVITSVRRAAVDLARRDRRRAFREEAADGGLASTEPFFQPLAEGDDRRQAIESALQRLPTEQREVLVLKVWGELTFDQIAAQLGLSPHTAASRYRYALAALRKELINTPCHG